MEKRPNSPLRDPQDTSNLSNREIIDVSQYQHLSLALGKAPHLTPEFIKLSWEGRHGDSVWRTKSQEGRGLGPQPPKPRGGQIDGDPPDPSRRRLHLLDPMPVAVNAQERILSKVFGHPSTPSQPIDDGDHLAVLLPVEQIERARHLNVIKSILAGQFILAVLYLVHTLRTHQPRIALRQI